MHFGSSTTLPHRSAAPLGGAHVHALGPVKELDSRKRLERRTLRDLYSALRRSRPCQTS